MRYFLISDNQDTLTGMRLTGIEGTLATNETQLETALQTAVAQTDIAILLITQSANNLNPQLVAHYKNLYAKPLMLTIPDQNDSEHSADTITQSIQQAIGIKM
jgi:V/A-type H+-transporting ATPase subunit F